MYKFLSEPVSIFGAWREAFYLLKKSFFQILPVALIIAGIIAAVEIFAYAITNKTYSFSVPMIVTIVGVLGLLLMINIFAINFQLYKLAQDGTCSLFRAYSNVLKRLPKIFVAELLFFIFLFVVFIILIYFLGLFEMIIKARVGIGLIYEITHQLVNLSSLLFSFVVLVYLILIPYLILFDNVKILEVFKISFHWVKGNWWHTVIIYFFPVIVFQLISLGLHFIPSWGDLVFNIAWGAIYFLYKSSLLVVLYNDLRVRQG